MREREREERERVARDYTEIVSVCRRKQRKETGGREGDGKGQIPPALWLVAVCLSAVHLQHCSTASPASNLQTLSVPAS